MRQRTTINLSVAPFVVSLGLPFILAHTALASDGSVTQVENFIRSVIQVVAGLAGLVAAGFFVAGGFGYITSSGHPEKLERSKHTLIYAAIGLAIVIAAFVISNIVTDLATSAFGK
ncbi:MAG TPA: pilin [Candidatus Saccharimonadales bacterium]|nr:pilin [Candidatus Saccharimonadales bacterium]